MSALDSIHLFISDFINADVGLDRGQKITLVNLFEESSTSLEAARKFIRTRNLDVVIPEDFANAIPAEADIIDNHGVKMVPEVSREHWSQSTPASGDCRYPLEVRIKMIGDLPSKAVEKLGKDEKLKINLDVLRPMMNKGAIDMHDKDCSADGARD